MLARAFEALEPGGYFILDFMNVPGILAHFKEQVITRRESPKGELLLLRESRLDLFNGRILKRWTYLLPDERRTIRESSVRLYMPCDLIRLLKSVGFGEVELYGDIYGSALSLNSPRCICLAQKPS